MADGTRAQPAEVALPWPPAPGATNMVTGIATAMLDSSPVVCITGHGLAANFSAPTPFRNRHHRHHHANQQAQT